MMDAETIKHFSIQACILIAPLSLSLSHKGRGDPSVR